MRAYLTRIDSATATGIVGVVMLLVLFAAGYTQEHGQAAPGAIIIVATPTMPAARQAAPRDIPISRETLPRLDRAIIAYDAPAGAVIGAIESGRAYRIVRVAGDWLQLDVSESGAIWTPAAPFYGLASEPTPAPQLPTYAPQMEQAHAQASSVEPSTGTIEHAVCCERPMNPEALERRRAFDAR